MKAFITGVNGQDGSYLAELLINKGYSLKTMSNMGSSQSIILMDNHFYGYSDTRKQDALCLGF